MRPADQSNPQYVARIERIDADARGGNVKVLARWYYRPEESIGGRRQFHGSKELFLSDHYDVQSADTIEGKCTVHSFKSYTKLDAVGNDDFFCRFEYNSSTGAFNPDRVAVYCKCEMPYNPDDLMVQCEDCSDWFHPACIEMTAEEAKILDHFFCETCSSKGQKKLQNSHAASRPSDTKNVGAYLATCLYDLSSCLKCAKGITEFFSCYVLSTTDITIDSLCFRWIQNDAGGDKKVHKR
ncbi:hypothetical protein Goari_000301 [Gossypium aridum]|uniref:Uncharacterized protein n=1 Tax=Gossypium aridum TaxID=34290 RepID=A0A7J8YG97_GOSAI|nr:hypothetical protein [Gossypium aridum]